MRTIPTRFLNFQSVPTTSYFKLIDIWLLFCVVMIVVAILLHTVLAAVFSLGGGGGRGRAGSARGAFRRIRTVSGSLHGGGFGERSSKFKSTVHFWSNFAAEGMAKESGEGDGAPGDHGTARAFNLAAAGLFALVVVVFNVAFWAVALGQHNMGPEEILEAKRPIR